MKPPTLKTLVIAIYVLSFPAAYFIGEAFGKADRFGSKSQTTLAMLIGLFCLVPFVMLFGWMQRIGPRSTRVLLMIHAAVLVLLLNPGTTKLAMLLPFPLFFVTLYFPQREARRDYEAWLRAKGAAPVANPPAAVLDKLDRSHAWHCYANTFALADGRTIPFLLWEGLGTTSTMASMGGSTTPMRTKYGLIAFSLAASDAGEAFIREIEALSQDKLTFWQRLKPSNQAKCPYLAERLPDGTFVVAWTNPHVAAVLDARLEMLRRLLDKSPHSSNS